MAVKLHEAGCFTWGEWATHLAAEIAAGQAERDPDRGDSYYHHWLAALEKLVASKGLLTPTELADRKQAWDYASRSTPHGQPIELQWPASNPATGPHKLDAAHGRVRMSD